MILLVSLKSPRPPDSRLLSPIGCAPLVMVLVRKDAEGFYTLWCCASRPKRWSRSRPQGSSMTLGISPSHTTPGRICIRSWRKADMFSITAWILATQRSVTWCGWWNWIATVWDKPTLQQAKLKNVLTELSELFKYSFITCNVVGWLENWRL